MKICIENRTKKTHIYATKNRNFHDFVLFLTTKSIFFVDSRERFLKFLKDTCKMKNSIGMVKKSN